MGLHACELREAAQFVSYPQMRKLGPNIGSAPERTTGSSWLHTPQWITTSSPTLRLRTALPTFQTIPEASLPPM